MNKQYISAQQLLEDSFHLGLAVYESGFRPDCIVGIWRGGAPVGIAVHELFAVLGADCDNQAIRTASYSGIGQREQAVQLWGLEAISAHCRPGRRILLVDDVHDSGLSLLHARAAIVAASPGGAPDIRTATPYFKPGYNQAPTAPDYFLHETDDWLVFPHELAGLSAAEVLANKPGLEAIARYLPPVGENDS